MCLNDLGKVMLGPMGPYKTAACPFSDAFAPQMGTYPIVALMCPLQWLWLHSGRASKALRPHTLSAQGSGGRTTPKCGSYKQFTSYWSNIMYLIMPNKIKGDFYEI